MKINVIVPVYNIREYLDRCIKSILSQTYGDFELILVDDGSTDGSGEVCDSFKDERVRVIHKENGGPSLARNVGLDLSADRWIMFVDGDDYLEPRCLELMVRTVNETGVRFVQCGNDRVHGTAIKGDHPDPSGEIELMTGREMLIGNRLNVVPWGKLFAPELFSEIRFPVGKFNEDYAIMYRIVYPVEKVAVLKDQLYHYTVRESSTTGRFSKKLLYQLEFMDEKLEFYRERNEKTLYDNALREKAYYILTCYHSALSVYGRSSDVCRNLKKRYLEIYPEVMKLDNITRRNRISLFLARYRPEVWVNMGRMTDRILRRKRGASSHSSS